MNKLLIAITEADKVSDKLELEENLKRYESITLEIMEIVKKERYEELDKYFEQRQLILDNINNLNCSKEEMKNLYLKYNIDKIEKVLEELIRRRKEELLEKIKENQKRKTAMSGYNNLSAKAVFLSKKY